VSFPAYPSYKDSGFGWLGAIPSDWQVQKFRHTFRESEEKIEGEVVGPMLSVSGYRGIEVKVYDDENRRRSDEDLIGYRIVRPGQLVVNTMWLNYAGLGVSGHEGHVSPAYRAYGFADENTDRRFIHHLMRSSAYVLAYTQLLTGIRPNSLQMSRADLMDFPIILPPLPAQRAIAAFLDRETAKIDALIEEQRHLIALLKEKRHAVISHAVSKGLDPHAPMKDSGIKWLGEVPVHWNIKQLKRLVRFQRGHDLPSNSRADGQVPVIASGGPIGWHDQAIGSGPAIVTGRYGTVGTFLLIDGPFWPLNTALYSIDLAGYPAFIRHALESIGGLFLANAAKSAVPGIDRNDVHPLPVAVPPIDEQVAIANQIDIISERFTASAATAEAAIALMNERRDALISAAVTGKIDVRSAVAAEQDRNAA